MFQKLLQSSLISATLASSLLATSVTLESGWNLLGTGSDNVNLSATFSSYPDVVMAWGFENNTKRWVAYGNNSSVSQLIQDKNITNLEFIPSNMGYWVLNSGSTLINITLVPNGSSAAQPSSGTQINFTFGSSTTDTASSIFTNATILFSDWGDEYEKNVVISASTMESTSYDYNGTSLGAARNIYYIINSDNNVSYSMDNGEQGYLIINEIKEITSVNGTSVTGFKYIDITSTVTQEVTTTDWRTANWQPTYYDQSTQQQVNITDISTLKNQYIDSNSGGWKGDDNNKYFFAASADTTLTSGDLVGATYVGQQTNCTPSADYNCAMYTRNSSVVGSWTLVNDVLTAETSKTKNQWRFVSTTFEEAWTDKVGNTNSWAWVTAGTDTTAAAAIENSIQSSYSK